MITLRLSYNLTIQYDDTTSGQMLCASVEDVFTKGELENFPDLSKKGKWPALMTTEDQDEEKYGMDTVHWTMATW